LRQKSSLRHLVVALLVSIPAGRGSARGGDAESLRASDREALRTYAQDTWKSVAAMADGSELPADGLRRLPNGSWQASPKTTPTDIASYLWSIVAAGRLGIIAEEESLRRLGRTISALERMERVHGFFLDLIDPRTGKRLQVDPYDSRPIEPILSSVDNAWLATALLVIRNACPSLRERADALLQPMDFSFFYVPYDGAEPNEHRGLIRGPYWLKRRTFGGWQLVLNTEQRIAVYIGIASGHLPREAYFRHARTPPVARREQSQDPQGMDRTYLGVRVFEGHYTYRGMRIVPSWGGSMFEALMVTLFVPEETWAPRSWGVNHRLYVRAQIEHGLVEARYGFWGFSPAANPQGGYRTYGIDALGIDPKGYTSGNDDPPAGRDDAPHPDRFLNGVVTPHASFLALRFAPRQAMDNLAKLKESFPIYADYGFMDSVNVSRGIVSDRILVLDQGMIMVAIANALADDAIRHAFSDGPVERVIRPLIEPEEFTAGEDLPAPGGR
jgi:hypothetical protein